MEDLGATILLVEDDLRLGRSLVRMITTGGYAVVHATTGEAAIENVMKRKFDTIVSDLNLPDSCGVDILKIARAHDPDVPLLLMSGSPTIDTTIEAMNLGVREYLVKPMSRERLARALCRATTGRRDRGARRAVPSSVSRGRTCDAPDLEGALDRAMRSLAVELDPVAEAWKVIGFTPRMWSVEPSLEDEPALIGLAERVGRIRQLRARGLELALEAFIHAPADALLFVDIDPSDLDGALQLRDVLLARVAHRVVFQVRADAGVGVRPFRPGLAVAKLPSDLAELDARD